MPKFFRKDPIYRLEEDLGREVVAQVQRVGRTVEKVGKEMGKMEGNC